MEKKGGTRKICTVFGSSAPEEGSELYNLSQKLGKKLAELGFVVRNGGYSGTMEGASKGAREVKGSVVEGCIVSETFSSRPKGNEYLTDILDHDNIHSRLETLTKKDVNVYVVLPGSIGTLNELVLVWCLNYINIQDCPILVWKKPWEAVIDCCIQNSVVSKEKKGSFTFVEGLDDAFKMLESL